MGLVSELFFSIILLMSFSVPQPAYITPVYLLPVLANTGWSDSITYVPPGDKDGCKTSVGLCALHFFPLERPQMLSADHLCLFLDHLLYSASSNCVFRSIRPT